MKNIDIIKKAKNVLKNQEHQSVYKILAEIRDLLKESLGKTEVIDAVENAYQKGKPKFDELMEQLIPSLTIQKTDAGDVVLLSHPCEDGEYSLMYNNDEYHTNKIDKPLKNWYVSFDAAQVFKLQGNSLVSCWIPVSKICAVDNPVNLDENNTLTLDGKRVDQMSLSVEPGVYKVKEKYIGDW